MQVIMILFLLIRLKVKDVNLVQYTLVKFMALLK